MVRPRPDLATHVPRDALPNSLVVRTSFALADGSIRHGYCVPTEPIEPEEFMLGYLVPAIVTEDGRIPFWFAPDWSPSDEELRAFYDLLGRRPGDVFPIGFAAEVELGDNRLVDRGVVPAFLFARYERGDCRIDRIR
jgi:hypothetical protein